MVSVLEITMSIKKGKKQVYKVGIVVAPKELFALHAEYMDY